MNQPGIEALAKQLEEALRDVDDIGAIIARTSTVEVFVWTEKAAQVTRDKAMQLGIPRELLGLTRPVGFLNPYPGDDPRNAATRQQYFEENVIDHNGDSVLLSSMPPIVGDHPRILVLGSMPGNASLEKNEYYAHPRNRFWKIVEDAIGIPSSAPYQVRLDSLKDSHIALWDVLKYCVRVGSLDASIQPDAQVPNDIPAFLAQHPTIHKVLFNDRKSESLFRKHLSPQLPAEVRERVAFRGLPSTSPANAGVRYHDLLAMWQAELH